MPNLSPSARVILVTLNDCRRQEFSVTAYTAVTNFKSAVNSDREYKKAEKASGLCLRLALAPVTPHA